MKYPIPITFEASYTGNKSMPSHNLEFDTAAFLENTNPSYIVPQCSCKGKSIRGGCSCGNGVTDDFIYAFGDICPVLPSLSIEKEFYNVAVDDPADKHKPFDNVLAFKYLSNTNNIYIAREINWVFKINNIDRYIIKVTTNRNLSTLIETIAPRPNAIEYDIIIGKKSTVKKLEETDGELLPVVVFDQIYNVTNEEYYDEITNALRNDGIENPDENNIRLLFGNVLSLANNSGDQDKYRALNFIVLRYMKFYVETYKLLYPNNNEAEAYRLVAVNTNPPEQYGKMKIMEIIFQYQGVSSSSTRSFSCSLNIANELPYLVQEWSIYFRGL